MTRKSDGLPIGAVAGFCNMLKLLVDMKAAPDLPTWRSSTIRKRPSATISIPNTKRIVRRFEDPFQFPLVRDATRAFGVPSIELAGYEADELIASYACQVRDAGGEVVIVSPTRT